MQPAQKNFGNCPLLKTKDKRLFVSLLSFFIPLHLIPYHLPPTYSTIWTNILATSNLHPANPYYTTLHVPSYLLSLTSQPSFHNTSKHPTFAVPFVLHIILYLVGERAYNSGHAFFCINHTVYNSKKLKKNWKKIVEIFAYYDFS